MQIMSASTRCQHVSARFPDALTFRSASARPAAARMFRSTSVPSGFTGSGSDFLFGPCFGFGDKPRRSVRPLAVNLGGSVRLPAWFSAVNLHQASAFGFGGKPRRSVRPFGGPRRIPPAPASAFGLHPAPGFRCILKAFRKTSASGTQRRLQPSGLTTLSPAFRPTTTLGGGFGPPVLPGHRSAATFDSQR